MKTYTMSGSQATSHQPEHPERTARRNAGRSSDMNFDVIFQVWPNRQKMVKAIRLQEQREPQFQDWKSVILLTPGEGY